MHILWYINLIALIWFQASINTRTIEGFLVNIISTYIHLKLLLVLLKLLLLHLLFFHIEHPTNNLGVLSHGFAWILLVVNGLNLGREVLGRLGDHLRWVSVSISIRLETFGTRLLWLRWNLSTDSGSGEWLLWIILVWGYTWIHKPFLTNLCLHSI